MSTSFSMKFEDDQTGEAFDVTIVVDDRSEAEQRITAAFSEFAKRYVAAKRSRESKTTPRAVNRTAAPSTPSTGGAS